MYKNVWMHSKYYEVIFPVFGGNISFVLRNYSLVIFLFYRYLHYIFVALKASGHGCIVNVRIMRTV